MPDGRNFGYIKLRRRKWIRILAKQMENENSNALSERVTRLQPERSRSASKKRHSNSNEGVETIAEENKYDRRQSKRNKKHKRSKRSRSSSPASEDNTPCDSSDDGVSVVEAEWTEPEIENPSPIKHIFIGNPGVGKTTLINSMVQKKKFESGLSEAIGLTTTLQMTRDRNGHIYYDTIGLADVSLRNEAALAIQEALNTGGLFKVIFVVTLESLRIKTEDKSTMKAVLDAAPSIKHSYSIIVNKLSEPALERLKDPNSRRQIYVRLNEGLPGTNSIFYNPESRRAYDRKNKLLSLSPQLLHFLASSPVVNIPIKSVKKIDSKTIEEAEKLMEKVMGELEINKSLFNAKGMQWTAERKRIEKEAENQRAANQKLTAQYQQDLIRLQQQQEQKQLSRRKRGMFESIGTWIDKLF